MSATGESLNLCHSPAAVQIRPPWERDCLEQGWCPEFPMLGRWRCTFGAVLFWLPRSSFRPGRGHSGVLAVAGCLLSLSYGNFFASWCCFTTPFLCISTPGGTLLPSGNGSEGAVCLLGKQLIPHRNTFKHISQLTLPQATLALSHLKTSVPEWVSRCVGYDLQSSHVLRVFCGVWEGGRIVWRQKGEVDPGGALGTWLSVPHSTLKLLPGLWGNWGYWFGSCSPIRTCITEHAPLPQPLQHKVRALGLEPPSSAVSCRCQAVEQGAGWLLSVDLAAG